MLVKRIELPYLHVGQVVGLTRRLATINTHTETELVAEEASESQCIYI